MTITPTASIDPSPISGYPPNWYADPWGVAPLRWWDGQQWTPILHGPYGEAWPLAVASQPPFVAKGPGIKGGGIAAVGVGVGFAATVVVVIAFGVTMNWSDNSNSPWFLLVSQLALWVGFVGAVIFASRRNGTGSLTVDYGLAAPRWKDAWLGLTGGIVARVLPTVFLVLYVVADGGFGHPNGASPQLLGITPSGMSGWVVVVLLTVVGAPIVEELFFRGLLQGAFTRRIGAVPAIFVTAIIFSFAHITSEGVAAPLILFPSGLILGYLRHRTGKLAAGMVAHATFNASLFVLFLVPAFR